MKIKNFEDFEKIFFPNRYQERLDEENKPDLFDKLKNNIMEDIERMKKKN